MYLRRPELHDPRDAEISSIRRHIASLVNALVALLLLLQPLAAAAAEERCGADGCTGAHAEAVAADDGCAESCDDDCSNESSDQPADSGDRSDHDAPSGSCAGSCDCCIVLAPVRLRPAHMSPVPPSSPAPFPPAPVASLLMLPRSVDHPPCRSI
ncbi:MAG TPA: hypothetical protein VNA88_05900 [Candidatus Kapabacteria bacterium]|nr:hypothetical protein [Candidatus Kapabacteria bacterium]